MNREKREEMMKIVSGAVEEVIRRDLDPVQDEDEIDAVIEERISSFEKAQKKVQRLLEDIRDQKIYDLKVCQEYKEFFLDSSQEIQQIFFLLALKSIEMKILEKFLENIGIIIVIEEYPEDPLLKTIRIYVPGKMQPKRIFNSKIYIYIKKKDEFFDFNSILFEKFTKSWMYSRNIGGSDGSLGLESRKGELTGSDLEGGGTSDV